MSYSPRASIHQPIPSEPTRFFEKNTKHKILVIIQALVFVIICALALTGQLTNIHLIYTIIGFTAVSLISTLPGTLYIWKNHAEQKSVKALLVIYLIKQVAFLALAFLSLHPSHFSYRIKGLTLLLSPLPLDFWVTHLLAPFIEQSMKNTPLCRFLQLGIQGMSYEKSISLYQQFTQEWENAGEEEKKYWKTRASEEGFHQVNDANENALRFIFMRYYDYCDLPADESDYWYSQFFNDTTFFQVFQFIDKRLCSLSGEEVAVIERHAESEFWDNDPKPSFLRKYTVYKITSSEKGRSRANSV